jgi:hypothetical protein
MPGQIRPSAHQPGRCPRTHYPQELLPLQFTGAVPAGHRKYLANAPDSIVLASTYLKVKAGCGTVNMGVESHYPEGLDITAGHKFQHKVAE